MITFTLCLLLLVTGYFTYGKLVERLFAPDDRPTPVQLQKDGVDFIALPNWKIFMIQFLNIAGLGPIFGAVMGAKFGESSYLWIVLGCIFAGAVHDFTAAMLSIRHGGESLPETIGRYLGLTTKQVMRWFSIVLLVLVGAVFVAGPAALLAALTPSWANVTFWVVVIFVYYMLASILPIDAVIGKIYPLFAFALLFMAAGLLVMLYVKMPGSDLLPEMWQGLGNTHPQSETTPIFPFLFVSIACGAISGFHATQSPMMCRCLRSERHTRPIFYGAMITEGIVALIWAAVATYYFHNTPGGLNVNDASVVVFDITRDWLGVVGGILALLGVVAAPITTGDTALRSARLIVADMLHIDQRNFSKRISVSIAIFAVTMGMLLYNLSAPSGFNVIWRYFAWANQALSVFTLWAVTAYLVRAGKCWWPTLLPALFMTSVCVTYLCAAPECLGWSLQLSYIVGGLSAVISVVRFAWWKRQQVPSLE